MKLLPELKIGDLVARLPIIQGGMAVRVSTAPLAAAVANEGGIGLIAATAMSIEELKAEIRKARELSDGIIGINIMFAAKEFANLVKAAIEEKIDLVVTGAGFSRDIFGWGRDSKTPIVSIVSSAKLAKIAQHIGASAVVVEGKEAGGHLGTDRSVKEIVPEVREAVTIPVIAAGGIMSGRDILDAFEMGADGVQMGTRFAASVESNLAPETKEIYVKSTHDDVVIIDSPVGLPGRSLKCNFVDKILSKMDLRPEKCDCCLKHCSHNFCILKALEDAKNGDLVNGLIFSGEFVDKIKEILPVHEIFKRLLDEVRQIKEGEMTLES